MAAPLRRFARRAWPLLAWVGSVYAVGLALGWVDFGRTDDGYLLVFIAAVYALAAAVLIATTSDYTLMDVGQIGTYVTDAAVYFVLGAGALDWLPTLSRGQLDDLRAGFVVSGPAFVAGYVWMRLAERERRKERAG